jgi:dTDP-4-dehydrorhamnose 3,5-epimerase
MARSCEIPGVVLIAHQSRFDARGSFTKLFHPEDIGLEYGQAFPIRESFISWSEPGVLRGMHFQSPPFAHDKAVTCLTGEVLDVILDLRRSSPTYGQSVSFHLNGAAPATVWIPVGCAHGFAVLGKDRALLHYAVTAEHSPTNDLGVRWDSFGFKWPCATGSVISDRDRALARFSDLAAIFP